MGSLNFSRFAVAFCMGIAAASIGWFLSVGTQEKLLLALLAACCAIVAVSAQLRNSTLGFRILIVIAVVLPLEFGGTASRAPMGASLVVALAICMIWLLDVAVLRRGASLVSRRAVMAALAFAAATLASFVICQLPLTSSTRASLGAQALQLLLFLTSVGLFLAVGRLVKNVDQLRGLTWLFLGAGAFTCATQIVFTYDVVQRLAAPVLTGIDSAMVPSSVGSVFWVWLVALSLGQALFNRTLGVAARFACGLVAAAALFRGMVLARSWVSGWLPPAIAVFIVLLLRAPRLTIVCTVLTVVLWLGLFPPTTATFVPSGEAYSEMTRIEAARALWPLIMKSPLIGLGPANYYQHTQLHPILGWYVTFSSHNQYLDLLAQVGFIGALTFGWLIWEVTATAWNLFRTFAGGFCQSFSVGVLAGLGGTLAAGALADWIIPFYFNIGVRGFRSSLLFWMLIGGILVLKRAVQEFPLRDLSRAG